MLSYIWLGPAVLSWIKLPLTSAVSPNSAIPNTAFCYISHIHFFFPNPSLCIEVLYLQYSVVGLHRLHKSILRAEKCLQEAILSPHLSNDIIGQVSKFRRIPLLQITPEICKRKITAFTSEITFQLTFSSASLPVCS